MSIEAGALSKTSPYSTRIHSRVRWSRILSCAEWIAIVLLAAWLLKAVFVSGWQSLQSEFPDYYLAAKLERKGIPLDRAYEWTWFQRQNDRFGVSNGLVSFAPNPPSSVLPILPLASLSPLAAKRVWMILNLGFFGTALWMLKSVTCLNWRRLALISLCCVIPLHFTFIYGRYYVLVLLLITAAYYAFYYGYEATSGALWAAATLLKLFPVVCLIFFFRKRDWRALIGFLLGAIVLLTFSILIFGAEVHRVFLYEVLPQAFRGDWLAPYYLPRNTFITLWSHLFLFEPELNPLPLINSPLLYALLQACTITLLIFSLLIGFGGGQTGRKAAVHWAALIPLMLLLSPTTGIDHCCVLIFAAVIGFDVLMISGKSRKACVLVALYVATGLPLPEKLSNWLLLRLVATTLLYVLLLWTAWPDGHLSARRFWSISGIGCFVALTISNLYALRYRDEDFSRRLPVPADAYRVSSPVTVQGGIAFSQMKHDEYGLVVLRDKGLDSISLPGDTLTVAGSNASPVIYAELAHYRSEIVRISSDRAQLGFEIIGEGREPVVSANGKWLAFIRQQQGKNTVWLQATDSATAVPVTPLDEFRPVDITVSSEGDLIAAVGKVSDPQLVMLSHETQQARRLSGFPHPARYPSISPDGSRVAFSRRESGSWHLLVSDLKTGMTHQLTHASCNAISPSWRDPHTLLYATDCGHGVGLSAIAWTQVPR